LFLAYCNTEDEVIEVAHDADGIINQYAPITRRVIESLKRCKVIARYGVGVDNIDIVDFTPNDCSITP
jgi:D-3-phosphoglycerate dehydrogenase